MEGNLRPFVSILINNYNYGHFLRDAIDSALNQTYSDVEVIVVDDGSTDNSREIIASYAGRVIPILKDNGGHGSTFNAGFAASRGSLICYLDSDDVWLPTKVERVVETAIKHPEAVFIYHRVQPASADLCPIRKPRPTGLLHGDISDRVMRAGGWWACAPTSAQCLTRSVLERIGPLPEAELRTAPDAFFQYLVPFLGPVAGVEGNLALYRRHGANDSGPVAAGEKKPVRRAFIAQLERYERLVDATNARLDQLGSAVKLSLDDHWGYQSLKCRTGLPGHVSRPRLAWRALRFSGIPPLSDRLKVSARCLLQNRLRDPK